MSHTIGSTGINPTRNPNRKHNDNDQTIVIEIADYEAETPRLTWQVASFRALVIDVNGSQHLQLWSQDGQLVGVVPFKETV